MTKKARFINKLNTLSNNEKAEVTAFFNKYPNYENRIDWNHKELKYSDFEKVFALAERSKNKQKQKIKENPMYMFENYNCEILYQTEDFIVVVPLDWECAVFLNSYNCGGEGAKWCIGNKNYPCHWFNYTQKNDIFAFVLFKRKMFYIGKKIIFQYNKKTKLFSILRQNDKELFSEKQLNFLFPLLKKFGKYLNNIAEVIRVIRNELPKIDNTLWRILYIPKYYIKENALLYWSDKNKKEIKIPLEVASIGSWVFDNCKVENIHIPESVESIGIGAFNSCKNLKTINIPKSVTNIGCFAFGWCKNLEAINIPYGVKLIEYGTFIACENLKSIYLPYTVKAIDACSFENCKKLESINFSEQIIVIGKKAFYGCNNLTGITIPKSVKFIDKKAFSDCENLESIKIPKTTRVARNAFKGCKKIKIIRY